MKKLLPIMMVFFLSIANAQDLAMIEKLKNMSSQPEAEAIAEQLKNDVPGNWRLYKLKDFPQEKKLAILYAPADLSDEQIKSQGHYNNCLYFIFNTSEKYSLYELRADIDNITFIWFKYFKPNDRKENLLKTSASTMSIKGSSIGLINKTDYYVIRM